MLERLELEAFLVLAEELHFGRTAARLHVSTGRISQTIKALERRVGAPLFDRTNRRVRLTPLGHRLHEDLRPAYEQIQEGLERARASVRGPEAELRVGFVGAAAGQVVHQAADLFPERETGCRVHVRETQVAEALARLREGEVDLLVLSLPLDAPDLVVGPVLISEPRMLAVPAGHALARRSSVTLEDLAAIPLLRLAGTVPGDWLSDRHPERTHRGQQITYAAEFHTFQEALQLIGAGKGAVIVGAQVDRFYARPDIVCLPLTDAPPVDWAPVWPKSRNTPVVRAFAATAVQVAQRIYLAATHD